MDTLITQETSSILLNIACVALLIVCFLQFLVYRNLLDRLDVAIKKIELSLQKAQQIPYFPYLQYPHITCKTDTTNSEETL